MAGINKENNDEVEIDLLQIFRALLRKLWLLILVGVVCAAIGLVGTRLFITPTYSTTFTGYVNNHNSNELLTSITSSDMSARSTLANTTAKIATSSTVLEQVARKMGIDSGDITVNTSVDSTSGILTVRVVMKDRSLVEQCAKELAEVLTEETTRIIEGSSLQVIDAPKEPDGRYSPSYSKNTLIMALIGVLIAAVIIVILELKDDTLKDASELDSLYGIPVVGAIPDMASSGKKSGYYRASYGYGGYADAGSRSDGRFKKRGIRSEDLNRVREQDAQDEDDDVIRILKNSPVSSKKSY